VGLLRPLPQPVPHLVLDAGVRQPDQGPQLAGTGPAQTDLTAQLKPGSADAACHCAQVIVQS